MPFRQFSAYMPSRRMRGTENHWLRSLWKGLSLSRSAAHSQVRLPLQVTRQRHTHDCADSTLIQRVTLNDNDGPPISRA